MLQWKIMIEIYKKDLNFFEKDYIWKQIRLSLHNDEMMGKLTRVILH